MRGHYKLDISEAFDQSILSDGEIAQHVEAALTKLVKDVEEKYPNLTKTPAQWETFTTYIMQVVVPYLTVHHLTVKKRCNRRSSRNAHCSIVPTR